MRRLELTVAADGDLFDILAYGTAVHGEAESDLYYSGMIGEFAKLCENPGMGPREQSNNLGLCRWRFRRHHIFYRVDPEAITIVRVLHVASDATRWLGGD